MGLMMEFPAPWAAPLGTDHWESRKGPGGLAVVGGTGAGRQGCHRSVQPLTA